MLNKKIFEDGLAELEVVFNFSMTKTRAEVWYKYSKHIEDSLWKKKIAACIKGCRKIPALADILDIKGYYADNTKEYESFEPVDEIEYKPIPESVRKKIDSIIKKVN